MPPRPPRLRCTSGSVRVWLKLAGQRKTGLEHRVDIGVHACRNSSRRRARFRVVDDQGRGSLAGFFFDGGRSGFCRWDFDLNVARCLGLLQECPQEAAASSAPACHIGSGLGALLLTVIAEQEGGLWVPTVAKSAGLPTVGRSGLASSVLWPLGLTQAHRATGMASRTTSAGRSGDGCGGGSGIGMTRG